MMPSTRRSALILGCSALLLAGCISVDVGNRTAAVAPEPSAATPAVETWFRWSASQNNCFRPLKCWATR